MKSVTKPVILYAEDDYDDFEGLRDALEQLSNTHTLVQAKNGTEVQAYLQKNEEDLPGLIVLDLNMPVMDGKETLLWLKNHNRYSTIPTMVFTTSSRDEDLKLCKSYDCTFFRKPTLYRDLLHIGRTMLQMSEQPS